MISFKNVTKEYLAKHCETNVVLKDFSCTITPGSFTIFIGESGSGKSTILKLIAKLLEPTKGTITSSGTVGMVFQSGALLPWRTVWENVALPLETNVQLSEKEITEKVSRALQMLHISELRDVLPKDLSGGQRQRVGIARALVIDAEILLLDEPFSALDIKTTSNIHKDLIALWQATKKTIIMVSHSIEEAVELGQTIHLLHHGSLIQTFTMNGLYPRDESMHTYLDKVIEIKHTIFALE